MSEKTSQPGTNSDLRDHETSGIYAPVRLTQPIPRQRYGWRAAIIVLAHALLLAVFLWRLDFLSDGSAVAKPEALDIIVVDISEESDPTPRAEPMTEPAVPSPVPQDRPLTSATEPKPPQEPATIPVESSIQPTAQEPSVKKQEAIPDPPPPPPRPAPAPAAALKPVTSNTADALSSSRSSSERQQPATGISRESESQTTPPRLDPAYLHNPAPNYPALSKRNRESGTVLLLVKVDPDGNATAVTLHQSSGYDRLDQAAVQAVTRWRFVPGMRGQNAISATVIVPISFKQP